MSKPTPTLDRRDILATLFPSTDDILFITGLAGSARDAAGLTNDGDNLFTMAGAMGAAVPMGLGVALAAPEKQVAVVTGDGELLMNIGSLASVATMAPGNLSIVCIDNGCHGETGGQTGHTSNRTDLVKMAEGAGLASAPRFLQVRVTDGPPTDFKRNLNPAQCRTRFRNAYLASR